MGLLQTVALVILGISGFTFIALFGKLPAFRKTPVGWLHRAVCIHLPNGIASIDDRFLGGRLLSCWDRSGNYILHENHPLVFIFFATLLIAGQCIFIPSAWSRISTTHQLCVPIAATLPYIFLYASIATKSYITSENHSEELDRYPYDRVIYHPGRYCRSCQLLKPARSKHCSFCKACVSCHDHHCVWLMNCVGLHNYRYFLALILSLSVMLIYGSFLGFVLLSQSWEKLIPPGSPIRSTKQSWNMFLNIWAAVISTDIRVGAVTLLMAMTAPLAMAFLVYHTYLIWAGTTTNESAKWSDWKEDIADNMAYKSTKAETYGSSPLLHEYQNTQTEWPVSSDQVLVLTDAGPPREGFVYSLDSNMIKQPINPEAPIDQRWALVRSMNEIDNIYDLGFWNNLRHAFGFPTRRKTS